MHIKNLSPKRKNGILLCKSRIYGSSHIHFWTFLPLNEGEHKKSLSIVFFVYKHLSTAKLGMYAKKLRMWNKGLLFLENFHLFVIKFAWRYPL